MNITEKLKAHFESQPTLQQVWVNESGEWQHFDHPAYTECVTREEVLGGESGGSTEVKTETKVKTKAAKAE